MGKGGELLNTDSSRCRLGVQALELPPGIVQRWSLSRLPCSLLRSSNRELSSFGGVSINTELLRSVGQSTGGLVLVEDQSMEGEGEVDHWQLAETR